MRAGSCGFGGAAAEDLWPLRRRFHRDVHAMGIQSIGRAGRLLLQLIGGVDAKAGGLKCLPGFMPTAGRFSNGLGTVGHAVPQKRAKIKTSDMYKLAPGYMAQNLFFPARML